MTAKAPDPVAPRRRGPMAVALLGVLALGILAWWQERPGQPATAPAALVKRGDHVRIDYFVAADEWGPAGPRLCDIAVRHGLDEDALAATLYEFAGGDGCASPHSRVAPGTSVSIVVSARSPFPQCRALASLSCTGE